MTQLSLGSEMKGKLAWTGGNMEAGITPFSTIAGAKEKRSDDVTETKFGKLWYCLAYPE